MRKVTIFLAFLFFCGMQFAIAQTRITGTVTSADDGLGIPGVSVIVKGTTVGTITDTEGKYSLSIPEGSDILSFSFVGMITQDVTIGNQSVINVQLKSSTETLDEFVVTALGVTREKKSLGYAVDDVSGKEITDSRETNFINALSGKVPGLQIVNSSSGLGGGSRILLRGVNSLTGDNEPLIIVDGIPYDNSSLGNIASGAGQWDRTDYGSGISDINPDDIADVSVLKGPNAAALYGSRAANGAIIITTKKGTAREGLGISYNGSATWEKPLVLPEFQNEYGQGSNGVPYSDITDVLANTGSWGGKLDGSEQLYWTDEMRPYVAQPDNVKDFFQTGQTIFNSVSIDKVVGASAIRFSYTNTDAKGILPNSKLVKNNFNLRGNTDLTDWLHFDAKITYFEQNADQRPFMGDNSDNPVMALYAIPRNVNIDDLKDYKNPDGTLRSFGTGSQNPYWTQYYNENTDKKRRLMGYAKMDVDITKHLSGFVRLGYDKNNYEFYRLYPMYHVHYGYGSVSRSDRQIIERNADFLLTYTRRINEDFDFNFNVGGNTRYYENATLSGSGSHFIIPFIYSFVNTDNEDNSPRYSIPKKEVNSLYSFAQVAYKSMLYLDISGRSDWSSTLPSPYSYFYPSANLSFVFSELMESDILSFGKVRFSYANVGNDTKPYQLLDVYKFAGLYNGIPEVGIGDIKLNPNLKPEFIKSTELGFDLNFLNNRVNASFTYYNTNTKDLITVLDLPAATGYRGKVENVGSLTNKGFEFSIGGKPYESGDFSWNASFNFSKNTSKLEELAEGIDVYQFLSMQAGGGISVVAEVGGGFGDIRGTDYLYNENGKIVVDANGLPMANPTDTTLGNYQAKWLAGLSNTLTYKDFQLSFLIDCRIGGMLYSYTDASMVANGTHKRTLEHREDFIVDGVTEDGSPNTTEANAQEYYQRISGIASEFMYEADNIRMREVVLSYRIPTKGFNKYIKGASISLVGRNLFFLYKKAENFDPESSWSLGHDQGIIFNTLPTVRSIGINLKVNF